MAAGTLLTRDEIDKKSLAAWKPSEHLDRACTLLEEAELNFAIWGERSANHWIQMAQAHAAIAQAKMTARRGA